VCEKHRFEFEIDLAIRSQVIEKLEASPEHPLKEGVAPALTGIYALYRGGKFVYGGKALEETTLKGRLSQHCRKIDGRQNINVSEVSCRWLEIASPWFVRAAEDAIITHYKGDWQQSGFGSHDPGKGRPGIKKSKWDTDYPPK
jgi:hypothetical protein